MALCDVPNEVVIHRYQMYGSENAMRFIFNLHEEGKIGDGRAEELMGLLKESYPGELACGGITIRDNDCWK